jgi:hypothetical protein
MSLTIRYRLPFFPVARCAAPVTRPAKSTGGTFSATLRDCMEDWVVEQRTGDSTPTSTSRAEALAAQGAAQTAAQTAASSESSAVSNAQPVAPAFRLAARARQAAAQTCEMAQAEVARPAEIAKPDEIAKPIAAAVKLSAAPLAMPSFAQIASSSPATLPRVWSWLRGRYALTATKRLRLAETVSLGEKRFVALITLEGREFLIGGGASGVSLLAQLGPREQSPQDPCHTPHLGLASGEDCE